MRVGTRLSNTTHGPHLLLTPPIPLQAPSSRRPRPRSSSSSSTKPSLAPTPTPPSRARRCSSASYTRRAAPAKTPSLCRRVWRLPLLPHLPLLPLLTLHFLLPSAVRTRPQRHPRRARGKGHRGGQLLEADRRSADREGQSSGDLRRHDGGRSVGSGVGRAEAPHRAAAARERHDPADARHQGGAGDRLPPSPPPPTATPTSPHPPPPSVAAPAFDRLRRHRRDPRGRAPAARGGVRPEGVEKLEGGGRLADVGRRLDRYHAQPSEEGAQFWRNSAAQLCATL